MRRSPGPSGHPRRRFAGRCSGRCDCCGMRWNRRGSRMQCRNVLTRIDALRTHELPEIEQQAVESHLKTCRSCNASTDDVGQLAQIVKKLTIVPTRSCRDACSDSVARIDDVWVAFTNDRIRMITSDSLDELRA